MVQSVATFTNFQLQMSRIFKVQIKKPIYTRKKIDTALQNSGTVPMIFGTVLLIFIV